VSREASREVNGWPYFLEDQPRPVPGDQLIIPQLRLGDPERITCEALDHGPGLISQAWQGPFVCFLPRGHAGCHHGRNVGSHGMTWSHL
jgi:hypothetical protein